MEDEIKVGEFVRTIDGHLGKVVHKTEFFIMFDNNYNFQYRDTVGDFKLIVKHSFNVLDLIKEGDYVNGHKVLEKTKIKNNAMQVCILKDNNSSNWITINERSLKSILTKEQFDTNVYKLKE